ncbi:MAG TPA: phospholipase D-like domain-containing protein [Polyangiaceae bacterium LLY-WYZ-15_(1-7)]|nr:cardiolipin synthase [Sandaracinus sp.]HJL03205.1 phospholipase D-like domain-containing protein [Polyangiaceae bacterium LLY-WYZ-15_(1-7)]HJL11141.1 phospholipase D-like domain-containing protein [Polyangiaceae bacterium LLY-WYZ-15_(1-7)]HJL37650.1 phospholipase D-like domain-containing protein [Polyangiaceae bacterium LLY-WYZ-15_(1-7)]
MSESLRDALLVALAAVAAGAVTSHALWTKRDPRSTVGWVALAWLSPFVGAFFYLLLGINRIRRRATRLRSRFGVPTEGPPSMAAPAHALTPEAVGAELAPLARALGQVSRRPLLGGNSVTTLPDGDAAYPAMIAAIEGAKESVALQTYIFEAKGPGARFVEALAAAVERGVEVRVLVDAAGTRYGRPAIHRVLRRRGVTVARFLPALFPWRWPYVNLRQHRKVMVVDGRVGFVGGLNIRPDHVLADEPAHPTRDVHFRLEGPVVAQLSQSFAEDWFFIARERLTGPSWFPKDLETPGEAIARVVTDGPDEEFDRAWQAIHAALVTARERIAVCCPYFLPDAPLLAALQTAARRGVRVDVVIPAEGNLRFIDWAMAHLLDHAGLDEVHVWRTPPPFDHAKLFVIDSSWSFVGSANWDPRSLRLNFETNVELYDAALATELEALIDARIATARPHAPTKNVLARFWHSFMFLFQPYL